MFRFLLNMLLIIIIAFTASAIPINQGLFHFSETSFSFFTDKEEENNMEEPLYKTNLVETDIINPTHIDFILAGNLSKEKDALDSYGIIVEVYRGENLIKEFSDEDILIDSINKDNGLNMVLDISQDNLDLVDGYYSLKIYSPSEEFTNITPYEIKALYMKESSNYIPAKYDVDSGYMYLTLYFPDKEVQYSIPISRRIPHTRKTINATVNNLYMGPAKELGLINGSPIPEVKGIWIKNKTAVLNLPEDIGVFDQGSASSQSALNSFVNSITSIYGVDNVKFLQNGREVEAMFHGTYVKEPFGPDTRPKVYLGYRGGSQRFLLVPIPLENIGNENINAEDIVLKIFEGLKTSYVNDYIHKDLIATLPDSIKLNKLEISDRVLLLDFDKKFLEAFGDRKDLKDMMLDSILFSFTSIPDINKVKITIEGEELEDYNGRSLKEPLSPPNYINIEE